MRAAIKSHFSETGPPRGSRAALLSDFAHSLGDWSAGPGPVYRRLAGAIRGCLERGDAPPGSRLPAERRLARLLGLSRTTVVAAYEILRQEERIESRQGSGTRVLAGSTGPRPFLRDDAAGSFRRHPVYRGLIEGSGGTIEFLGAHLLGAPSLARDLLPLDRRALSRLMKSPGYFPMGLPELRRAVALHVTGWGLPSSEEQILVTNGAQQAIALAGSLFLQRGDAVALENPTYLGAIDIFAGLGARLLPVPVGRDGASIDALRATVQAGLPRLLYLMPTFQNPTGALMPEKARRAVARLSAELQLPVLEDNTLADLALGSAPPPPIAAFAPEAPILTVGSLSKLFWGGLRVGWIRASEDILARIARLRIMADLGGSLLSQLAAVRLLARAAKVREARRGEIRERLDLLTRLLGRHLPAWSWMRPAGGLSLWVRLPEGDASEFAQVAVAHGVSVVPGNLASPDGSCSNYLRLPYVLEKAEMEEGIARLSRAWTAYASDGGAPRRGLGVLV